MVRGRKGWRPGDDELLRGTAFAAYKSYLERRFPQPERSSAHPYVGVVRQWLTYCEGQNTDPLTEATAAHVERFCTQARTHAPGRSSGMPSARYSEMRSKAVRSFSRWAVEAGLAWSDPTEHAKVARTDRARGVDGRTLTPADLLALTRAARTNPLDLAVLLVLADTGIRPIEARRLRLGDYHPRDARGPIIRVKGRGRGPGTTGTALREPMAVRRLTEGAAEALDNALRYGQAVAPARTRDGWVPLLRVRTRAHGELVPLTEDRLALLVRRLTTVAGIGPVAAHDFRRTWVRTGLACGYSPQEIRQEIGHRSVLTTLRYCSDGPRLPLSPHAGRIREEAGDHVAYAISLYRHLHGGAPLGAKADRLRVQTAEQAEQARQLREYADLRRAAAEMAEELARLKAATP
ncbi:tyrosine-type recombinase/integrase [Streptomyces sp. NBC_00207]|uniref:tyrosine-type recombinase/integrase n=1 Tax=Streptomyces sp. NBC_00207 TaxID=2903635 RepID=UPI003247F748